MELHKMNSSKKFSVHKVSSYAEGDSADKRILLEETNFDDNDDVFETGSAKPCHSTNSNSNVDIPRSSISSNKNMPARRQIKLKIFLALLACIIITVFILVWQFYAVHNTLPLSDGNRTVAEINTDTKILTVLSLENEALVTIDLDSQGKVSGNLNDLQQCNSDANSLCLTWKQIDSSLTLTAQQFGDEGDIMHCVKTSWRASGTHLPKDCLHLATATPAVWFGTHNYIVWHNNSDVKSNKKGDANSCVPFIPGSYSTGSPYGKMLKNQGANVIEPLLFSSRGAAVKVGTHHATELCYEDNNKLPQLCIEPIFEEAHQDEFHKNDAYRLDYVTCISDSLPSVYKPFVKQFVKPNLKDIVTVKPSFQNVVNDGVFFEDQTNTNKRFFNLSHLSEQPTLVSECKRLIEKPLWNFAYREATEVGLIKQHLGKLQNISGTCHLKNVTQVYTNIGDYVLKRGQYFSSENFLTVAQELGLDITLPVTPFVNYDALNFAAGARSKYFVYNKDTEAPLLTSFVFGDQFYPAIVDLTSSEATEWLADKVNNFKSANNVTYFQFYYGQSTWLPRPIYTLSRPLHNPGHFSTLYAELALRISRCSVIDVAFDSQILNQFVLLSPAKSMRDTLSSVLAAGLAGYPFVVANLPAALAEAESTVGPEGYGFLNEGIIRWIEMVSFFPVVHIPWDYDIFRKINVDFSFLLNITEKYLAIRNGDEIGPELKKAFLEAELNSSKPIVAPMWMAPGALSPNAPNVEKILLIEDQFMIGDNVFVAPIVEVTETFRTIFVPPGKWRDIVSHRDTETDNGKWLRNYEVSLSHIPVFLRTDAIL